VFLQVPPNQDPVADAGDNQTVECAGALTTITLDGSASYDPDGDNLNFSWWIYQEAGTYAGKVSIDSAQNQIAQIRIPTGASGRQIHLIERIPRGLPRGEEESLKT
jgi:hypothetical protein